MKARNAARLVWLLLALVALLALAPVVQAQEEGDAPADPGDIPVNEDMADLPDWVFGLSIGATSVAAIVFTLTEIVKALLRVAGLYRDGFGRYVAMVVTGGLLVVMLVTSTFGLHEAVAPAAAALLNVSQAFLGLLAAVGGFDYAKRKGLLAQ
jgi:uncharacterized membrane protein